MVTEVNILGHMIPVYGLLGVGGVLLGLLFSLLRSRRMGLSRDDCAYIYVFGAVGAVIGAKLLYLLTVLPGFLADVGTLPVEELIARYLTGGLVFYGGLLGAVAAAWIAARRYKADVNRAMAVMVPGLCLAHACGRIGCHLVGCCYGVATEGALCVIYTHSAFAPNGTPLLPVQLMEACFELVLFVFFTWYSVRTDHKERVLRLYLALYAVFRFVLEFFRGDDVRGILGGLSVSQWISIVILLCLALRLILERTRRSGVEPAGE